MPICPKCGNELELFKGKKFVCSNDDCDFSIGKEKFAHIDLPWFKRLCYEESLWQKEVFEAYPCIIAHEYWRLYDLLDNGQTYGALLQVKDVFEVLLKFPTLIAASTIYKKRERSDEENKILIALLEKPLTLGTWERIARTMSKHLTLNDHLAHIQSHIVSLFKQYQITSWRNKTIGHGALAFDADTDFQQDIRGKLALIATHFQECAGAYSQVTFLLKTPHQVRLHGKANARNLKYTKAEIWVRIEDRFEYSLLPYILLKDRRIYFFDAYFPRNEKTSILNYPEGDKQHIEHTDIAGLYAKLLMDDRQQQFQDVIDDEIFLTSEQRTLEKITEIDDFQTPGYLTVWLKEMIKNHAKGLFLLQMERGTGKTTFARALDQQSMCRIRLSASDNFCVRSYYVNSSYLHKVENFTSKVSVLLMMDVNGRIAIQGNLPVLSAHSDQKREDFATLLNFYRKAHEKYFGKEYLLFIIDGLDEIPAGQEHTIFDFLPLPEMLDNGVYLLLTCRTEQELSRFVTTKLKTITLSDAPFCVARDDPRYIEVLKAYAGKQIKSSEKHDVETLLDNAKHRFLYLKMINVLTRSFSEKDIATLSPGKALFNEFLDSLQFAYGEKFFVRVITVLSILSTAFVPVTLHELSYLCGEERPTFKLLAYLLDLRWFLKSERSYRGNLISVAHQELRELVAEKYHSLIHTLLQKWIADHTLADTDTIDLTHDGQTYLLAYIVRYVEQFGEERLERVFNSKFADRLFELAAKLGRLSTTMHHQERTLELYTEIVQLREQFLKAGSLHDVDELVAVFVNRGVTSLQQNNIQNAIADFDRAITIRQRLLDSGSMEYPGSLARVLVNRGTACRRLHKMQEAIADFNRAVEIQQECLTAGTLEPEYEMAATLVNRGILHMENHEEQQALADFDQAIRFQLHLHAEEKLPDGSFLVNAWMNRAILHGRMQQFAKAIEDYTQIIEFQKKLLHTGQLVDENALARTYVNRGIAFHHIHERASAIPDFTRSLAIQERLRDEGKLAHTYELAWTLMNRGKTYASCHQPDEALGDLDRAVKMQQALLQAGELPYEHELALALIYRGIAYTNKDLLEEALSDFDRAISMQQTLIAAGILRDEDELAWGLLHRGIAFRERQQMEEAYDDFNRAIAIQQRLREAGTLLDPHDLALALMHRGIAYNQVSNAEKAVDDLEKALDITKELLPGKPYLLETYAQIVYYLLVALNTSGKIEQFHRIRIESETIFERYPLTEEAAYWHSRLMRVVAQ